MTMANFIPIVWASRMLLDFREIAIGANLVNREYEGEARSGNTVRVNTGTAIDIKDYKTGVKLDADDNPIPRTTAPDKVASTKIDLLIDQEKSFDFLIDDIDRAQAAGSMQPYTQSAAEGMAEDADQHIFASISGTNAHLTASNVTTGDGAHDIVRNLRKALNKNRAPQGQRVLVVNAEFEGLLLSASSKLTDVDRSGSPAGLREASLGRLLGFDVYTSENLPVTDKPQALAWYRPSFAYVSQIEKMEPMRDQDSFSDRLRGLHVYGSKAVRPAGIVCWTNS